MTMDDWLGTGNLRFERDGFLAWCRIDRPRARNAMTPAMYYGVKQAVTLVNEDPTLAALIVTGVGDVFSAGGDLAGRTEEGESIPAARDEDLLPFLAIRNSQAPVIAAINGICHAGGVLIAMLADITVASDRASFRVPELLRGIPDATTAAVLPVHTGIAVARDLLFSCRVFDAEEAVRLGVISRVVPHERLEEAAVEAAQQVLQTAPEARMHVKRMLNERYGLIDYQTQYLVQKTSTEMREGMAAFVEKRQPSWIPEN
jgi:enoyl-CoA hydratase